MITSVHDPDGTSSPALCQVSRKKKGVPLSVARGLGKAGLPKLPTHLGREPVGSALGLHPARA